MLRRGRSIPLASASALSGVLALTSLGCGGVDRGSATPTSERAACGAGAGQDAPDLMAWDAAARANLSQLRKRGVVAVRYERSGCEVRLELLPECVVEASRAYHYEPYARSETKIARSEKELYASFPLGAGELAGKVGDDRSLRTDFLMVGTLSIPPGATGVEQVAASPACERATHLVSTIYVGGFALAAGETQQIESGGSVFGIGAGGASRDRREQLLEEGSPTACRAAQSDPEGREPRLCNAPLRVNLVPIPGRAPPPPMATPVRPHAAPGAPRPAPSASGPSCTAGMTRIEGGTFLFHGKPTQLATFCMDQTEVTIGAYMACVHARACLPPSLEGISSSSSDCNFRRAPNLPMTCINPAEAATFCRAQDKRLPTEAHWDYAAFGFDGRRYPWGNGADGDEVCIGRSLRDGPCPVGSHPKGRSAFGLDDMGANVAEIVESGTSFRAMGGHYGYSLSSVTQYQAAGGGSPTWGVRCMAP